MSNFSTICNLNSHIVNINWCNKGLVSTIICDIIVTMQYYLEIAAYKQAVIMRSQAYANTYLICTIYYYTS